MTPQQAAVAQQVDEFWRERGLIPAVSPFIKRKYVRHVHAMRPDDPVHQALCASGDAKIDLVEATGIDLLKPPCRRCLRNYIYRKTGIEPPKWW